MAETVWRQRIRRAENLAVQHSFAGEILGFYIQIAGFQQDLYRRFERGSTNQRRSGGGSPAVERASRPLPRQQDASATNHPDSAELFASFPRFLNLVAEHGPSRLAQDARDLCSAPAGARSDLLDAAWSAAGEPPSSPEEFLALAFLQPYAEFVRSRVPLQLEGYTHALCPFCSRKPGLGVLRQMGDGARRNLLCGFCLCEWEFRRIVCPGCDEKDYARLPVYTADEFPYIRVECCDTCHTYIKSIDLSKNGLANPLVDELASVPLDLWAQGHGYAKLHPNLLGM